MSYTALALVGVVAAVSVDLAVLRVRLLRRRAFWVAYAIVLGFQLSTNGWLTGRRIVTYNPDAILGNGSVRLFGDGRVFYAPVEDVLFGFALVLFTLDWWVFWGRRDIERLPASTAGQCAAGARAGTPPRRARTARR